MHQIELEMQNEELRQAQLKLDAERARYFDLYDLAPVGYVTLSAKGLILKSNLIAATLLGVGRGELVKRRFTSFMLNADHNIYYLHRKLLFDTGAAQACDVRLLNTDGAQFWAHLDLTVAQGADGGQVCLATLSDISARVRAEEALQRTLDELEQRVTERTEELRGEISERKKMEDSLHKSEERFQFAMNVAQDGIWDWDISSGKVYYSPSYLVMLGYLDGNFPPHVDMWLDLIHPDDKQRTIDANNDCVENRSERFEVEFRMLANDSQWKWILGKGKAVTRDMHGKALRMVGTHTDITERKQAENALNEEYNFRTAIENSMQAGVAAIDMEGKQISVNRYFSKMVGWTADELIGKSAPYAYWPSAELENINRAFQLTLQGKAPEAGFELKFIRKNGELFDVLVNLSALENSKNETIGWLAVVTEITERKRVEDTLRRNQAMLARTESIAQIGSWEWDVATDTVTWSDELFRFFQRNPADGAPSFAEHPELYYPEDMRRLREAVEAAISNGTPYEIELRAIRADGATRVCLARGHAEMTPEKHTTRLFGSLQDITERKRAEEALQKSEATLEKVQEIGHMGSWEIDLATKMVTASAESHRIYGIPEDSVTLIYVQSAPLPEFRSALDAALTALITKGERYDVEFKIQRLFDGEIRAVHSIAEYDASRQMVIGSMQDITERKQAEEKLQKSEASLRAVFENSALSFLLIDLNRKIQSL